MIILRCAFCFGSIGFVPCLRVTCTRKNMNQNIACTGAAIFFFPFFALRFALFNFHSLILIADRYDQFQTNRYTFIATLSPTINGPIFVFRLLQLTGNKVTKLLNVQYQKKLAQSIDWCITKINHNNIVQIIYRHRSLIYPSRWFQSAN